NDNLPEIRSGDRSVRGARRIVSDGLRVRVGIRSGRRSAVRRLRERLLRRRALRPTLPLPPHAGDGSPDSAAAGGGREASARSPAGFPPEREQRVVLPSGRALLLSIGRLSPLREVRMLRCKGIESETKERCLFRITEGSESAG